MKTRIETWCDRIIVHGLGILGVLVALCYAYAGYNSLLVKVSLLWGGTAVLAGAWVIKALERQRLDIDRLLRWPLIAAFAFLLSAIISYMFVTSSRDTSFDELVVRIPYFVLMTIAALEFRDMRKILVLVRWLMVAAFVFSAFGLVQHFQIFWSTRVPIDRIYSTFGNPNFYVGFLIPCIALVLSFFNYGDPREFRALAPCVSVTFVAPVVYYAATFFVGSPWARAGIFAVLAAVTIAVCAVRRIGAQTITVGLVFLLMSNLLLTQSRSGQIGISVMLVSMAILMAAFLVKASVAKKMAIVAVLSAATLGIMLAGVLFITQSRSDATIERKYFALGAVDLIKQKPVIGHGLGTFKYNYPLVRRAESWKYNLICFQFASNAYNEFLEIWHDEGAIGIAIFLWLIAAVGTAGFAALKHRPMQARASDPPPSASWYGRMYAPSVPVLLIGLTSGAGALLFSNMFSLSMRYCATGYVFWTFLGLILALATTTQTPGREHVRQTRLRIPGSAVRMCQAGIVLVTALAVWQAYRYYRADVYLASAIEHSRFAFRASDKSGEIFHDIHIEGATYVSDPLEWQLAISDYLKTLRYNPHYLRARYFLGNAYNRRWIMEPTCNRQWGDPEGVVRTDAQRALEQYHYISGQAPNFIEMDYELGDLYLKRGEYDKSIAAYSEYKRLRPFFTKIHTALARAHVAKQDWANAAEAYKDALDLNRRFVMGYCELSAIYRFMNETELAEEAYRQAADVSPESAPKIMADVHARFKQWDLATGYTRKRIESDSAMVGAFSDLGWYYVQQEKWPEAIAAYEKATGADSTNVTSLITLSNLYYQQNRLDDSKEMYRRAMAVDPQAVQRIVSGSQVR